MAKAMLIIDMPKACYECPFAYITLAEKECFVDEMDIDVDAITEKPTWCPLKEIPQKKENNKYYALGYNACIDEILGGAENE